MLVGTYNNVLVLFSILVAILASYTAMEMASRISSAQGRAVHWWLIGGASAMGLGIWSMHFIGMLAFGLSIPVGYDPVISLLSLLISVGSCVVALWLVCQRVLPWSRLACGAVLLGAGISGTHYAGMAAMRMEPGIRYIPSLFILSIVLAILISASGLWITFNLHRHLPLIRLWRVGAATAMGFSIVGIHYIGMAAAQFPLGSVSGAAQSGAGTEWLALTLIIVTLVVLAMALIISVLDMRLEARTYKLTSSLAEANRALTSRALHDSLTKLPNRVLLEDRLDRAIRSASREQGCFALMFLDLDGFKRINDAYGHRIGDLLLVDVARRLTATVRSQDTIARLGGDEFVLLACVMEQADAATLADKVLRAIREPFEVVGHSLYVSTSIGIAMYSGNDIHQCEWMNNADAAMYYAKATGRNTYCFFDASINAHVQEQLPLVQDLCSSLSEVN